MLVFQFVQIAYWLALATWFGAVLFATLAPPVILRTVRETNPILPGVLSVNLDGQHGTLLAGTITSNLMSIVMRIELACAAVVLLSIGSQWFLVDLTGANVVPPIVRTALAVGAAGFLVFDWRVVWPKVLRYRQEYLDHADEPDVANPALDQFDKYQTESLTILRIVLALLLGLILFSATISFRLVITPT